MSERVYAPAGIDDLRELAADRPVTLQVVQAASSDEEDEYEALLAAAELGPVVVTAEVDTAAAPIRREDVQSFHLDADGSGDLAWYAPQEIDQVIELLQR